MNSVWKTALDRIHAEEQLKERTRTYLAQQLVQQLTRRRTHWRPALASLCLLLMLALGSYWLFLVPTAFISIDLNPSLELSINRFDRVIAVQGYNDEGQAIADSLQLQYLDYRQALQELLDSQEIGSYLEQDAVLSMTVSGQDSKQCGSILREVEGCAATHQNIHCHAGDIELVSQAHAAGMSLGKYQAFLILQQIEGNLIYPKVVGSSVGLPSIWVLAAVTIGGSLMGIVGMLIFIPIVSVVYTLFRASVYKHLRKKHRDIATGRELPEGKEGSERPDQQAAETRENK